MTQLLRGSIMPMNARAASIIPLFTFPVAYLLIRFGGTLSTALLAIAIVAAGLILATITCVLASRSGDALARKRSIGGIIVNALYLALLVYLMFYVFPGTLEKLDEQRDKAAALKQQQQQQQQTQPAP